MTGKWLFAGAILVAASQPSIAAAQSMHGAIGTPSHLSRPGRSQDQVRGALFGSAMSGAVEMQGAGRKQRNTQRRIVEDGTAEGALLNGAGLLSAAPHLGQLPVCAGDVSNPSFDCQILKRRQAAR
ncbi:MAG TPA: hypothetical protein VF662_00625 [Allosphingosinicella sp.]|jgi:hypothetical protein